MSSKNELLILTVLLLLILASPSQIGPEDIKPPDYFVLGEAAYQDLDMVSFLENAKQAVRLAPQNPKYLYLLARAHAVQGNAEMAMRCLERAVDMGFSFSLANKESPTQEGADFSSLADRDDYRALLTRSLDLEQPVQNSDLAFEIHEKGLMPEGIAYDPVEQAFYVGSIRKRKILKIDRSGKVKDFAHEEQDDLWGVTGMVVDSKCRMLWVNSSALRRMKGSKESELGAAGVFKYDLASGRLIKKYILKNRPLHLFNGIVAGSKGDVYITDSLYDAVYLIPQDKDRLEVFIKPSHFSFPNGIAISDDDRFLYVSHVEGTSVIDLHSRSCALLNHPDDLSLALIDGLSYYQGSLLAIQGAYRPERVVQYFLEKSHDGVKKRKILEANNRLFDFPTSGVVVNGELVYIANSQSRREFSDDASVPGDMPQDVLIMKVTL